MSVNVRNYVVRLSILIGLAGVALIVQAAERNLSMKVRH